MKHRSMAAWMIGLGLKTLGMTCRVRTHRDLRHVTRRDENAGYIFAALHAHQIGSAICGDHQTVAMVSRSGDGAMIVPTLKRFGIDTIRGSGGKTRKGGARAVIAMTRHIVAGGTGFLAVDGPNGPRGHVHGGVAMLAKKSGRPVFAVIVVPSRRWILGRTWDRLQIPKPFSTIHVHFSRPLRFKAGQTLDSFAEEVRRELVRMERWYDADEAEHTCVDQASDQTPNEAPDQASNQASHHALKTTDRDARPNDPASAGVTTHHRRAA